MEFFKLIRKKWGRAVVIAIILIIVIPFFIDKIFSKQAHFAWLGVYYDVGDILSFYGTVLGGAIGGITALMAVYFTMKYYEEKDAQIKNNTIYDKQILKINKVIEDICNRDVINYDLTLSLGFSKALLTSIIEYNESLCRLKGFFTEYGMGVLNSFQWEYDNNLKESKLSSKAFEKIKEVSWIAQRKLGIKFSDVNSIDKNSYDRDKLSVIEFLNLKPELRQCAERIGHLALYENASDLIHSDPTLSYILEIEGGGSAGLWASLIHDQQGAFSGDSEGFAMWDNFSKLVRVLLIKLDEYKNDEYSRIVAKGDASIVPKYYIKKSGSFMHETTTVEEYQIDKN